ncbi:FtsK/SpoIIIE domain-containing protein [Gracilibacillus saliphilus]|uniref:FtsK/SpoIIIE domain-containing protein n=1 Tax=Gracilibacillus saliphilus TaxID=543890 RepID=UPI0013D39B30|nr:FtsK/SpoIIIE domain-containing protein [Gracilibacillus saliphilus]
MLVEASIWLGISAFLHYSFFRNKSDREKIDLVFENIKYGFKEQMPFHIRTIKSDNHTTYIYHLPYGLIDDPKLETILHKTLNKPVTIKMQKKLFINVYDEELKSKYDYYFQDSNTWTLPIGFTLGNKNVYHDFDQVPHMTVSGMTRQGKTVLLKLILAHLSYNHPEDVEFYIVDLKGGLEFSRYQKLRQVKEVASNVDEAYKLLQQINKNIKSDMQHFKSKGYSNILDTSINKRTFVIVDEAAELTPAAHHSKEEKNKFRYCQQVLSEVCRVAGALGYRNIFCTQYPTADTLPRQIKQNSDAKISFRLPTEIASRVAIDEQGAEELTVPGRAIYRTHDKQIIQVPFISDKDILNKLRRYELNETSRKKKVKRREDFVTFG